MVEPVLPWASTLRCCFIRMMDVPYFLVPAPDGSDRAHLATLVAGAVHRLAPLGFAFGRVSAVSPDYVAGLLPVRATRARVYRAQLGLGGTVALVKSLVQRLNAPVIRRCLVHAPHCAAVEPERCALLAHANWWLLCR